MKKLITFILVLIMMLSMSVNVFAWSDIDLDSNYASQELIDNAPPFKTGNYIVLVYGNTYYSFGSDYQAVNFYVDLEQNKIMNVDEDGNSLGFAYSIWNADGQYWTGDGAISDWGSDGFYLIGFTSDNVTLRVGDTYITPGTSVTLDSIEIATLPNKTEYIVGDVMDYTGLVVIGIYTDGSTVDVTDKCTLEPITFDSAGLGKFIDVSCDGLSTSFRVKVYSSYDEKNDEANMSIIEKITAIPEIIVDMLKDTFNGIIDFFKFIGEVLLKSGGLFTRLPELVTNLTGLFDTLDETLMLIYNNGNDKATVILTLSFVSFIIAVVNVFLRLFAGSKLGGGA